HKRCSGASRERWTDGALTREECLQDAACRGRLLLRIQAVVLIFDSSSTTRAQREQSGRNVGDLDRRRRERIPGAVTQHQLRRSGREAIGNLSVNLSRADVEHGGCGRANCDARSTQLRRERKTLRRSNRVGQVLPENREQRATGKRAG